MTEKRQKQTQKGLAETGVTGRNSGLNRIGAEDVATRREEPSPETTRLMEAVVERGNMRKAYARLVRNKGAAGIDRMTVAELRPYLIRQWVEVKEQLLDGTYRPLPVRGKEIPKAGGKGVRKLGIPVVLDRLIQQALHQVLVPLFDPAFSEYSYGFREGRGAHGAIKQAREYVNAGRNWVVDIDLEKFFDRVNHDLLMAKVARRVKDKRILRLIRKFLQAGMMEDGLVTVRTDGTPQGGPLSPLLSNIMLDELDKELEKRGHKFCRYADDCNIYVRSEASGRRVKTSITRFLWRRLKLAVNEQKSAVDRPWHRKFLGYSMTAERTVRLKPAVGASGRFKEKVRELIRQGRGRNISRFIQEDLKPLLVGWANYYGLAEMKTEFEDLDGWIRRHLRCVQWRQWKNRRTRQKRLMQAGLTEERARMGARNRRGPWWNAAAPAMSEACSNAYFDKLGLPSLHQQIWMFRTRYQTAVYGTVRTVV